MQQLYTEEELTFLRELVPHSNRKDVCKQFNEKFGTHTDNSIISKCKSMKLKFPNDGKFKVGNESWHKYMSKSEWLSHFSKETRHNLENGQFKKGSEGFGNYPIGTEVIVSGYVWIKISAIKGEDFKRGRDKEDKRWIQKHIYLYEQKYGKIPEDHVLIFLDNNPLNCKLNNLYCTSKTVRLMLNTMKWKTSNPNLTFMAIRWCEENLRLHHIVDGLNEKIS